MKFIKCWSAFFLLCFLSVNSLWGQYSLELISTDSSQRYSYSFKSRIDQQRAIADMLKNNSFKEGVFVDVVNDTSHSNQSRIIFSKHFKFVLQSVSFSDSTLKDQIADGSKLNMNKRISENQLVANESKILTFYENNGYPFVIIHPVCSMVNDTTVFVNLLIEKGPFICQDSIDIKGNSKISRRFMYAFLGLKKGRAFSEQQISEVEKKIQKLPFLQSVKSPELAFVDSNFRLILYLNKKNSSQFDGIVGILPSTDNDDNKPIITGDLKLNLQNMFGQGEQLILNWKRQVPLSQDLFIYSVIPYVFGSRYGVSSSFKLQKKDTTSLTNVFKIGGQIYFSGMNNGSVYFENNSSKLLSTSRILLIGSLNDQVDYKVNRYGAAFDFDFLNDIYIPTKGFKMSFDANIGTRVVIKNVSIPISYYEDMEDEVTQLKLSLIFDSYMPIFSKLILNVSTKMNYLSGQDHFENELYRIGGLNSLRGFNEESITATFVSIINTEIRWMIDRRTFVYSFWNGAYYEKRLVQKFVHDTPNGFGVGLSFDTPAGIFNITYALGKEFNNPIQLKYGKVHFGIVARF